MILSLPSKSTQLIISLIIVHRAGNEPNQLEKYLILDSIIDSLNLVHEPNESNLS